MVNQGTYDFCPQCGASIPLGQDRCPDCGQSAIIRESGVQWEDYGAPRRRQPMEQSNRPAIAGGLMILMGLPAFLMGLLLIGEVDTLIDLLMDEFTALGEDTSMVAASVQYMIYGGIVVGGLSLVGGFLAFRRQHFQVAIIAAVVLAVSGLPLFLPAFAGAAAAILLYKSRGEFY